MNKRIAVIGAGPAGAITALTLSREGHRVVVYDREPRAAGVFARYAARPFWQDLQLSSSKRITEFAASPAPAHYYDFMQVHQAAEYFAAVLDGAKVEQRLGRGVLRLELVDGPDAVLLVEEDGSEERFDHVIVCTGANQSRAPIPSPYANFSGQILHSDQVTDGSIFEGKRVLVKGMGESSTYLVGRLAPLARRLLVTSSHGCNLTARTLAGVPLDLTYFWQLRGAMPRAVHDFLTSGFGSLAHHDVRLPAWLRKRLRGSFLHNGHTIDAFKNPTSPASEYSIKFFWGLSENGQYYDHIDVLKRQYDLSFYKEVWSIEGDQVEFETGEVETVDVIVLTSGFSNLPSVGLPVPVSEGFYRQLYKGVLHPKLGDRILFNGFTRPNIGSFPQMAEMSAWLIAKLVQDEAPMGRRALLEAIQLDNLEHDGLAPANVARPYIHEYRVWMEKMARLLGRRVRPRALGFDPRQWMAWLYGPHTIHRYDLQDGRFGPEYLSITRSLLRSTFYWSAALNVTGVMLTGWLLPLAVLGAAWCRSWPLLFLPLLGVILSWLVQIPGAWLLNTKDIRELKQFGEQYRSYEWPRDRGGRRRRG